MRSIRISLRAKLCILLVVLFSFGSLISFLNYFMDFYAGYPLRSLEDTQIAPVLNRFLSENMFLDIEHPFDAQIITTTEMDRCIAVLFADTGPDAICGAAELERGPLGRYRVTRIQAGASAGTIQILPCWQHDFGIIYSFDCFPAIENYAVTQSGEETTPVPEERTFIQIKPLSGERPQIELFDQDGINITKDILASKNPEMPIREYTIGNPKFAMEFFVISMVRNCIFCMILCLVVWRVLKPSDKGENEKCTR